MIVDTSAVVAILLDEPERRQFLTVIATAPVVRISVGSVIETTIVAIRSRKFDPDFVDRLITRFGVEIVPVTLEQAQLARAAYRTYGRGTGHPARLNFGDCFAYALAKSTGEPLLFKGDDFAATDIVSAVPTGRAAS